MIPGILRLGLAALALMGAVVVALLLLTGPGVEARASDLARGAAEARHAAIAALLESRAGAGLLEAILLPRPGSPVFEAAVFDDEGRRLAGSSFLDRPGDAVPELVLAALRTGSARGEADSPGTGGALVADVRRVGGAAGRHVVAVGVSRSLIDAPVRAHRLAVLASVLATGGAAAVLARLEYLRARRRMRRLAADAERAASGNPSADGEAAGTALEQDLRRASRSLEARIRELELERREQEGIVAGIAGGLVALDGEDRIRLWNEAAGRLLGVRAPAPGLRLWEVVRDPAILSVVGEARAAGAARLTEVAVERPDVAALGVVATPVPPRRAGDSSGIVLAIEDHTDRKRLDDVRRDFVANVSHEMKTPLTSIQGYVETLLDGGMDDRTNATEFLWKVHTHALRLSSLVSDLIVLSRVESGSLNVAPEAFEAGDLLRDVAEQLRDAAEAKGHALSVPDPAPAKLRGDRDLLSLAVENLLDNAIRYTPEGGTVAIGGEVRGDRYAFIVTDSGIGIPEQDLPRIFERFYRVDKARSRALGGTGLGLSIVKHVAERHGGEVAVESRTGAGSTFTLLVPLAGPPGGGATAP